jgi:RNA polymerase sigma-70 factor (ECF subfamily)
MGAPSGVSRDREETELVARAQSGDRSAFERLYRLNVGRVHALCLRLTGRAAEAEEFTQETFIRAWQKLGSFQGRSRLSSWLHRLAVNLIMNERRTKSRSTSSEVLMEEPPDPSRGCLPTAPVSRIDLEQAVAALPEGARDVFVLFDVCGYRHDEIAEMTGIAVGTSKAQLHRARRLLRGVLDR